MAIHPDTPEHAHDHEHDHAHDHTHTHIDNEKIQDVDQYFRTLNPRVAFIELKDDASAPEPLRGIPLPIRIIDFMQGAQAFSEEIPTRALLQGMVWMLAIDPSFRYVEQYKTFMQKATKDPVGFALAMGMTHYQAALALYEVDPEDAEVDKALEAALLSFRGAYVLDPHHVFAAAQYARLLWTVGKESMYVEEASHILEHVLHHDEYEPLANAALGDLNERLGHFLKANAYYQRAMVKTTEEPVLEELRENMRRIAADVAMEEAIHALNRADYQQAIAVLTQARATSSRPELDYFLGIAYQNSSSYAEAAEAFARSLEGGLVDDDVYNGLLYALNAMGKTEEAIAVATEGLGQQEDALRLRFNRAVLYATQNENKKAREDLDEILAYDNISDALFNEVMRLREQLPPAEPQA